MSPQEVLQALGLKMARRVGHVAVYREGQEPIFVGKPWELEPWIIKYISNLPKPE